MRPAFEAVVEKCLENVELEWFRGIPTEFIKLESKTRGHVE